MTLTSLVRGKTATAFISLMTPSPFALKVAVALKLTWLAPPVQGSAHFAATKPGGVALVERGHQHLHAHQTNLNHYCQHSIQRTKTHAVNTLFLRATRELNSTR